MVGNGSAGFCPACKKEAASDPRLKEMKARIYPERKAAVTKAVECYRDRLLELADNAANIDGKTVTIPIGMAFALVDVCNFVERLDSYEELHGCSGPRPTPPLLQPHQQSVVSEKEELDKRATDLSNFIGTSPIFDTLDQSEQERLKEQNDVMWQYSEILGSRIAAFGG